MKFGKINWIEIESYFIEEQYKTIETSLNSIDNIVQEKLTSAKENYSEDEFGGIWNEEKLIQVEDIASLMYCNIYVSTFSLFENLFISKVKSIYKDICFSKLENPRERKIYLDKLKFNPMFKPIRGENIDNLRKTINSIKDDNNLLEIEKISQLAVINSYVRSRLDENWKLDETYKLIKNEISYDLNESWNLIYKRFRVIRNSIVHQNNQFKPNKEAFSNKQDYYNYIAGGWFKQVPQNEIFQKDYIEMLDFLKTHINFNASKNQFSILNKTFVEYFINESKDFILKLINNIYKYKLKYE